MLGAGRCVVRRLVTVCFFAALYACNGGDPREIPTGQPVSATIGSEGGELRSNDGRLTVSVPAGALTSEERIEIQEIQWEGGRAWALRPDGLAFAAPVTATITLPESEIGAVMQRTIAGEDLRVVPLPDFTHVSFRDETIEEDLEVSAEWREADAEIDYRISIDHFSVIAFVQVGGRVFLDATRRTIGLGEIFAAGAFVEGSGTEPGVLLTFRCAGEPELRQERVEARRSVSAVSFPNDAPVRIAPVGAVERYEGSPDADIGLVQPFECTEPGIDAFAIRTTFDWTVTESISRDCTLVDGRQTQIVTRSVECTDDCPAPDPVDLSSTPEGDPSLDLRCGRSGTWESQAWVSAYMEGTWPPVDIFSWYVAARLFSDAGEIGSYSILQQDGTTQIERTGAVGAATTHLDRSHGPTVLFDLPSDVRDSITRFEIESGMRKEEGSTPLVDTTGVVDFDAGERRR